MLGLRGLHWSIPVSHLEESEEFYGDFLGLELQGHLGGRATCFRVGDASFIIWETGEPIDPGLDAAGVHYAFNVSPEDWGKAVPIIAEKSVKLACPIVYRKKGNFPGREIYLYDPSGNRIELTDPTWKDGMPEPTFEEILEASKATIRP